MRWAAALALCAALSPAWADVPEPAGFRGAPYNAPVPATLQGARVIDDDQARELHAAHVGFLDVYPRQPRPAKLPPGTIWRERPHDSIPGAIWAPNTGYDRIRPEEEALLRAALAHLAPDPGVPVVIFCRADCWMSWNAAKRAIGWGYSAVYWYPDGTDGWIMADGELAPVMPYSPR